MSTAPIPPRPSSSIRKPPGPLLELDRWIGFVITGLVCLGLLVALSDYFDTSHGIEENTSPAKRCGGQTRDHHCRRA